MAAQNILVIHLGSTNSRSFLFSVVNEEINFVSSHEILTTADKDLTVESLKSRHKGEFDEVILIDNEKVEQEAFVAAVKLVSGDCDVLTIDLGSKKTFVGQGSFGRVKLQKYEIGVGEGAVEVLKEGRIEDIAQFLTTPWKFTDIENHIGQISLYPGVVPVTPDYLELTQAVARVALKEATSGHPSRTSRNPCSIRDDKGASLNGPLGVSPSVASERGPATGTKVFLTGAVFGKVPKVGQALLTFLDGAEPEGVFQVFVDKDLIFTALGALNSANYQLPSASWRTNYEFLNLGSVLVFSHQHPETTTIASLDLDLGLDEKLAVEVKAGEILRVPFSEGASGQVKLGLRSGVEIVGGEQNLKIEGGKLGFIIDARGRPLPRLPVNEEGRQKLKKWRESLEA